MLTSISAPSLEHRSVLGEEHQFNTTHRIEIAQAIGESPDARGWPVTKERLETPLSFMDTFVFS